YVLTANTIYVSLIHQFWKTASASTLEDGMMKITATIDGRIKTITEVSIRRHLKLEDSEGISSLPNNEIFEQLALIGCVSDSDRLTYNKGHFSSQWRFFIYTILHCLSAKKTAWDQFSSNIANNEIFEQLALIGDAEIAKQLQEAIAKADSAHDSDWNDPAGGYKQSHFKKMSYEEIRPIFKRVWDQIHAFVHMDSEIKKEVMKKSRFDLQQKQFAKDVSEKKNDSNSKPVGGSRKKIVAKKRIGAKLDEESAKRQKLKDVTEEESTTKYEKEKEEHRLSLKIIHNDESEVNYEPLSKKISYCELGILVVGKDGSKRHREKKYLLIKELLKKMLNLQLEAEEESTMAFELIKFIKSLLKE
nr:hypothetical protein [Tanacetum cinerariifolium]